MLSQLVLVEQPLVALVVFLVVIVLLDECGDEGDCGEECAHGNDVGEADDASLDLRCGGLQFVIPDDLELHVVFLFCGFVCHFSCGFGFRSSCPSRLADSGTQWSQEIH
jgi:hypothetical protein